VGDLELCGVSERQQLMWLTAYVELLQRFEMYGEATEIVANCGLDAIGGMNTEMTTIATACTGCNAGLYDNAYVCQSEQCRSALVANCALCRKPVKGLYVYCQGCGHGGHGPTCMSRWFAGSADHKHQRFCPTGCGHMCAPLVRSSLATFEK
jgi:hypothetical protein